MNRRPPGCDKGETSRPRAYAAYSRRRRSLAERRSTSTTTTAERRRRPAGTRRKPAYPRTAFRSSRMAGYRHPAARCSDSSRNATTYVGGSRSGTNTGLPERLARARVRATAQCRHRRGRRERLARSLERLVGWSPKHEQPLASSEQPLLALARHLLRCCTACCSPINLPTGSAQEPESKENGLPEQRTPGLEPGTPSSRMELAGLEPATSWVRSRRSPN